MRTSGHSSRTAILLLAMIYSCPPVVAWADGPSPAAAGAVGRVGGAANPITNGGFETVNEDGTLADWEFVGTRVEVTDQAHSGRHAVRFERPADAKGETGLNRAWKPDSGEQGKMLGQLKGGIRFWYQAIRGADCQMQVLLVPMSSRPMEDTEEPRTIFVVPADHVGDGQWHAGLLKFDYAKAGKVKWLHVGIRLVGGPGEMLFDDVVYVEEVGPALSVQNVRIEPGPATQADSCALWATIANVGDAPLPESTVSLKLPAGLQADKASQVTPGLPPDGEQTVTWKLTGERQAGSTIEVLAAPKGSALPVTTRVTLHAAPKLRWLLADRFLLAPGDRALLRCVIDNPGTAPAVGLTCKLTATGSGSIKGEPTVVIPPVPSGGSRETTWELVAGQQAGQIHVEAIVTGPNELRAATSALLEVTPAATAPAQPLVGPISIRKSDDRTLVELRGSDGQSMAWMPYLAKVVYQNGQNVPVVVLARADDIATKNDSAVVTSRVNDADGGTWSFRITIASGGKPADKLTRLEGQVECDKPRKLLAFDGPMLYVTGSAKTDAIFPGLEWLEGDEYSSSSLDFKETHPHRVRYVPHPRKVTVPCMGVHNANGTIGLLWDVHQRWNGANDQPQPVFACPDRFEGRGSTLMGLMAPNVSAGLRENARLATQPVSLAAGTPIRLTALVYCDADAKDSLAVVDAWFRQFGAPPPEPIPQGDYIKQIEFSMRAYTDSLWLADEKAWLPYLGGPGMWRKPTHSPGFCHELLVAAMITKDAGLAVKYRQLADEQLLEKPARAKPVGANFGFGAVYPVASLRDQAAQASELIDEQGPDGQWRFDAKRKDSGVFKGMDYHRLGPDNAAEVGTSARKAYDVLRVARLTNDSEAYQAGVLALEALTKFMVSRAAQVWEVPVHTPDILAAADALDACIEAYRFSRDPKWLAQARRWARAGLPFVYTWRASGPEHPWMLYGSIPVFGATWFEGSWLGRPVQWNGLRYGYALLKLAQLDPGDQGGYTWRTIATGLTHSAMHQQSTSGKNLALWPDSLDTISGERANWEFAPSQILKNVFCLIGRGNQVEPQTVLLAQGESTFGGPAVPASPFKEGVSRVAIDSTGEIVAATWKGSRAEFKLNYPPGEQGYSLVVGTAKPTKVTLDGRELAEQPNLEEQPDSGWRYDESYAIVVVRVSHDGPGAIAIDGVKPLPRSMLLRKVRAIRFEFDRDAEGWVAAHDLAGLQVVDGKLAAGIRGRDPYMIRSRCEIDGNAVRTIRVRMLLTGNVPAQSGEFYWATEGSPQIDEQKVVRCPIQADGQWHEYAFKVGDHPHWRGQKITQIRIDPGNGATTGQVQIDWVRGEP